MFEAIIAGILVIGGGCLYICFMFATAWAIAIKVGDKTGLDGLAVLTIIMVCSIFIGAGAGAIHYLAEQQVKEARSF